MYLKVELFASAAFPSMEGTADNGGLAIASLKSCFDAIPVNVFRLSSNLGEISGSYGDANKFCAVAP
jgi:hypothetical protein